MRKFRGTPTINKSITVTLAAKPGLIWVAYVFSLGCLGQTHLLRFQVSFDSEELVSVDVPKTRFWEGSEGYQNFHD